MSEMQYKIGLRKGDFEVVVEGSREWVEKKFEELISGDFESSLLEHLQEGGMPETLGEFLDERGNPKKHTDVVVVFGYWLFKKEKAQSFNVKDIVKCYDRTRKPKPTNPNQIINANVATHLFAEASGKKDGLKAWVITRPGEEFVEKMK